jgi:hypothetical protein
MSVGGQRHAPVALPPGRKLSARYTGDWVGSGAGLDGNENSYLHWNSDPELLSS